MTTTTDIVNRALQTFGTRTTVTAAELTNQTSNEAIQANIALTTSRDELLRMAPWDCGLNYVNMQYITSVPGTPENPTNPSNNWIKGQPPPPWAYEYQYPVDCLKACWMIPSNQTGMNSGVPITTAVTGGAAQFWQGPPVTFKVVVDQFYPVTAAVPAAPGSGYAVGDQITLTGGASIGGAVPIGAPAILQVATLSGTGVATVTVINQVQGSASPLGGSYFAKQTTPQGQASTTGAGTGATFNLTFGPQGDQRVIVCNQQNSTLAYVKQVIDPNVMDPLFQRAWINVLGGQLCFALTGDKQLANARIMLANSAIEEARKADGNEGLTVNNVTPDWIRARGIDWSNYLLGPYAGFDWGNNWPLY